LVEDDSAYEEWTDWADDVVDKLDGTHGYFGLGANSNGFFDQLLIELRLSGRYDYAMSKRRRLTGKDAPWTPGANPWSTVRVPLPKIRPRDRLGMS
jgi:hypothetical protein